jgi:hypothetical protein
MREVRIVDGEVVTADGYGPHTPNTSARTEAGNALRWLGQVTGDIERINAVRRYVASLEASATGDEHTLLREKAAAYDRINTPEIDDFLSAVKNEALHQRERWGVDQDGGKEPADWFRLVGYLAGKALHDVKGKRLHHIITTGAALLNWHAHAVGAYARMRPSSDEVVELVDGARQVAL